MTTRRKGRPRSAGILLYRPHGGPGDVEVFLVHPGGPFFAARDRGAWSLPKGEVEPGEEPLEVARREFLEETGRPLTDCARPGTVPVPLDEVRQRGGKVVAAWALAGAWPDGQPVRSNRFTLEWPPGSGRRSTFPEVDRGEMMSLELARQRIHPAQASFLDRLVEHLRASGGAT